MTRAAVMLVAAAALHGPAAQAPSLEVRGRVVAADSGNPLRNARVALAEPDADLRPVLTDAKGQFAIAAVRPGPKTISASKTGYAPADVTFADGIEIRLARAAAITGRVLDDVGAPIALMAVVAERIVQVGGHVDFIRNAVVETDDTGAYRLFGLPAGDFIVGLAGSRIVMGTSTAMPAPRDAASPLRDYYPDASRRDDAQAISVRPGDEVEGINFRIAMPPLDRMPGVAALPGAPISRAAGRIEGRVVRPDGLPVRAARVMLSSSEQLFSPYDTTADADGRYEFADLRPGTYRIAATDTSFKTVAFGQRQASGGGALVTVVAGATVDSVDISIPLGSTVSGRIVDESGDPIANANVRVEGVRWSRGRRRLASVAGIASRQTDDLGRFRIFNLPPGHYLIGAVVGQPVPGWETVDLPGYLRTYFPGTPAASEAHLVEVTEGMDTTDVDFALARGRVARVAGRAFTAAGEAFEGAVTMMPSARSGAIAVEPVRERTHADGSFEFARVPPGDYVIQTATARGKPSSEGEFGALFVTVNGSDAAALVVRMSAGSSVTGRVTFDGAPPSTPDGFELSSEAADADLASLSDNPTARADVHDDWTWDMRGLNGPRRLRVNETPAGWMLDRIFAGGVDVTDDVLVFGREDQSMRDIDIVLTDRVTEIAGGIVDERGRPFSDATVVAFAADPSRRYPRSRFARIAPAHHDGTFTLSGLPAGTYLFAAVDGAIVANVNEMLDDPAFVESLVPVATRVALAAGERVPLVLRVAAR